MKFYPIWLTTLALYTARVAGNIQVKISEDEGEEEDKVELAKTFEIEELKTRKMTKPCLMIEEVADDASFWACELDPDDYNAEEGHTLPILGLDLEDEEISGPTVMIANGAAIDEEGIDVSTAKAVKFVKAKPGGDEPLL